MRRTALLTALVGGFACSTVPPPGGAAKAVAVESCSTCHAELSPKLREAVLQLEGKDVHARAGLGCVSCHGGDATAKDARSAHRIPDFQAGPTTGEAMAAMCGRCHAAPAASYLKSPHHLANAPRRPDCATCHGAHGIAPASIALIGEPLCSSCHTVAQARRIHKALNDAEREVASADLQLAAAGNNSAERARLKAARSQLRGLSHGLDLLAITRNAANTLVTVDEVRAKAFPRVEAKHWGRRLRFAGVVLAGVMVVLAAVWGVRALRARKLRLPVPRGRELILVAVIGGGLAIAASIAGFRGYNYIEHDAKFCLSCHTMNSAYALWEQSGHKDIECHTCHAPDVMSNLHQLWIYATRRPDEVVKHAEIDRSICEKCHAGGGKASKWSRIIESPGHRIHVGKQRVECVQCHAMSAHRFKPPKETCATCHKQVTLTAAGSMAEMHCLQCHPFAAADAKRPLKPDRAACLECHENLQISGEVFPAKAPMKWDCGKCHKPHQRLNISNAECKSCHETMTEGVHRMKGHASCLDCHKPHGWNTTPASCASCHAAIVPAKHHPTPGKSCKDCHGAWDDEFLGPHAGKAKKQVTSR